MVIPITKISGILEDINSPTGIPAASAVSLGAPWIIKSPDKANPCPKRFIVMATPRAGNPTSTATGSKTAPNRATAGEGQKNQEIIIMTIPIVQKASVGVLMILAKGDIIKSLIPVAINTLLMDEIIEMTRMIDKSSEMAYMKLEKIPLMDAANDPVEVNASRKTPVMQTIVMSRLKIINKIARPMNRR